MDAFSERLSKLRIEMKKNNSQWTQGYVAGKIGVARVTYTAYERGTKQPSLETVYKLSKVFDVTTDYLLGRTDNPKGVLRDDGTETDVYELFMESDRPLTYKGKPLTDRQRERYKRILAALEEDDQET